VRLF